MQIRTTNQYLLAGLIPAAILVVMVLYQFDPNQAGNPLPSCPSRWLTGLYCPGCGATRALHALLHGDLEKALSMNPVFVLASPIVVLLMLDQTMKLPEAIKRLAGFFSDARPWAWVLIGFAILRNLPWYPFNMLAPG